MFSFHDVCHAITPSFDYCRFADAFDIARVAAGATLLMMLMSDTFCHADDMPAAVTRHDVYGAFLRHAAGIRFFAISLISGYYAD